MLNTLRNDYLKAIPEGANSIAVFWLGLSSTEVLRERIMNDAILIPAKNPDLIEDLLIVYDMTEASIAKAIGVKAAIIRKIREGCAVSKEVNWRLLVLYIKFIVDERESGVTVY